MQNHHLTNEAVLTSQASTEVDRHWAWRCLWLKKTTIISIPEQSSSWAPPKANSGIWAQPQRIPEHLDKRQHFERHMRLSQDIQSAPVSPSHLLASRPSHSQLSAQLKNTETKQSKWSMRCFPAKMQPLNDDVNSVTLCPKQLDFALRTRALWVQSPLWRAMGAIIE